MRALLKADGGPGLHLAEVPIPSIGPGDIRVKVFAGGICGTDLHIYMWDQWARSRIHPPRIIGHEFCGTVVDAAPDVSHVAVGDFIAGEGHLACGTCHSCRQGRTHICERLEVIGVDRDGAFADYVVMPARNAWKLAPSISRDVAAIMDPLGNAVHAALETTLTAQTVAVIGCGPIGLMAIPICRMAGAEFVAASDVHDYRLTLARRMGATFVFDARRDDVVARLRQETGGVGVNVVLEMSGSARGLADGLGALANGGWISLLGLPSGSIELDIANGIIFKEAHLAGIFGRKLWQTWEQATTLLTMGLDISPIITHRFPLERYEEGFALLQSGDAGKVILYL